MNGLDIWDLDDPGFILRFVIIQVSGDDKHDIIKVVFWRLKS